jgi:hypothetical protein
MSFQVANGTRWSRHAWALLVYLWLNAQCQGGRRAESPEKELVKDVSEGRVDLGALTHFWCECVLLHSFFIFRGGESIAMMG